MAGAMLLDWVGQHVGTHRRHALEDEREHDKAAYEESRHQ